MRFREFLAEGGAATASLGTSRANKDDITTALKFVSKHTGIPISDLEGNLLGTTSHTLQGLKDDSGDIDIAVEDGKYDREKLVKKMEHATGEKANMSFGTVFSFAVPTKGDKKVQVDLMFVPSEKWAQWGYYASKDSKHRGVVRNLLLINTAVHTIEPGKDIEVRDEEGNVIARARRSMKSDAGLERLFRIAPMRKDGKGRTALRKATPDEVEAELKKMGSKEKFSKDADPILDPDQAAAFLFGKGVKAKDLLSTEQAIAQIKKLPAAKDIFKKTIEDLKERKLPIPDEIKQYA